MFSNYRKNKPYHKEIKNSPEPLRYNEKPKLLDQVRQAIRCRHYSYSTEKTYVDWIKRYIFFHNKTEKDLFLALFLSHDSLFLCHVKLE